MRRVSRLLIDSQLQVRYKFSTGALLVTNCDCVCRGDFAERGSADELESGACAAQ